MDTSNEWWDETTKRVATLIEKLEGRVKVAKNPKAREDLLGRIKSNYWQLSFATASNPNAPPKELAELANGNDIAIQAAVAQNPSAPGKVLLELWLHGPEPLKRQIRKNPNIPSELKAWLSSQKGFAGLTFEEFLKAINEVEET
jgi:hypothetical protein